MAQVDRPGTASRKRPADGAPAIEVRDLTKTFGRFTAVDRVTFDVGAGEIFGFLGHNGAGKTTTIRLLLGLLAPSGGTARVLGHNIPREAKQMHRKTGYMSQLFTLYPNLTAAENIRFYGQAYGLDRRTLRRREAEIIEMAGLRGREDEITGRLSGGWKQRLALGCAIIHQPRLVFLDEPTSGVDPISRREFWELIFALAHQGVTVFVTTHYMDEAEHCQRIAFISAGRIVASGTPGALKEEAMEGRVLEITCDAPEDAIRALAGSALPLAEVSLYGALVHAVVSVGDDIRPAVRRALAGAGVNARAFEWVQPSLEDVFISLVRREQRRQSQAGAAGA
ncbi:MAG: ABC transporter ATP-binding protein [Anaerolineae bacterium]|nr:ABC transporter ATP-binding protein [Anaerolineae bacterium]